MSFLNIQNKTFLILGVANKKSIAWHIANTLETEGAKVIYSVRSESRKKSLSKLLKNRQIVTCDVEDEQQINQLCKEITSISSSLDGIVHSVAFANYKEGLKPFHETKREVFLQATIISAFSIVEIVRKLKPLLTNKASVVSIGISSNFVTAENYGYMSPVKSALEGCIRNLAKSFSKDTTVRFNTVNAAPLKTSASAGIPGYLENYLYAEKLTFRKRAVETKEVSDTVVFLLSDRASGINGQGIVVNAGMDLNYFDHEVIKTSMRPSI